MKIAIVVGSIRTNRQGIKVGKWVLEAAKTIDTELFELVDVKDFNLPIFADHRGPAGLNRQYSSPENQAWSEVIDTFDAYIFVTAEYNRSIPGGFKNAFDSLGPEWANKPIGFVGYGYGNSGRGSVAAWKLSVQSFNMQIIEPSVQLSLREDLVDGELSPRDENLAELNVLLKQIIAAVKS